MGVVVNTQDRETQPGLCIHVLLALYNIPSSCPQSSPSQPLSVLAMVKACQQLVRVPQEAWPNPPLL